MKDKKLYRLPTVRDEEGKIIPKEISPMPGQLSLYNEWFIDEIVQPDSPEDAMIEAIDAARSGEEIPEPSYTVRKGTTGLVPTKQDVKIKQFNLHELSKQTLTKAEREIFELITIQGVSYRDAEDILHIDHCRIWAMHKKILKKLGNKLLRKYKEE